MSGGSDDEESTQPGDGAWDPAPLSDLAERVGERRERAREDRVGELFAEPVFEALDPEDVWEDEAPDSGGAPGAVAGVLEEGPDTHVVSKRSFCERCRHLSAPPEVRCTHPGTDIREFVDKDHVRVSNCPVVEERGVGEDDLVG